jgi:4-hydroxy-2-oxoheptanedioate aldolase
MRLNRVKAKIAAGEPTFGIIATIPSVAAVQVLANSGFDWIVIDMEHGPIDLKAAHEMIVATAGTPTVPFARVAWSHHWLAKPVMDVGALGICFPMIRTGEEAVAAVRSLRYPPKGERLWGPFYAPIRWGVSMGEYMAAANDEVVSIVTIEHPDAIRNIDAIMAAGWDMTFVGTGDLASALEIPGQFEHPKLKAAVAEAEAGILRSKAVLGGVARTPDQAKALLDRGYRAIVLGFDWMMMQQASMEFLKAIRG